MKKIKHCAFVTVGFLAAATLYLRFIAQGDDPAGSTMVGFVIIIVSTVIMTAAAVFEKILQNAVDIQSENYLTV